MVRSMALAAAVPHFHFHDEAAAAALVATRKALTGDPVLGGAKLTLLPLIIKVRPMPTDQQGSDELYSNYYMPGGSWRVTLRLPAAAVKHMCAAAHTTAGRSYIARMQCVAERSNPVADQRMQTYAIHAAAAHPHSCAGGVSVADSAPSPERKPIS